MTGICRQLRVSLAEHAPLLLISAVYAATLSVVRYRLEGQWSFLFGPRTLDIAWQMIPAALFIPPLFYLLHFHVVFFREWRAGRRSPRELPTRWKAYARCQFSTYRLSSVILACIGLAVMFDAFQVFKQLIPAIQPFAWDRAFMEADRLLHGGVHPWEWLHPLLSRPAVTQAIDFLYWLWLPSIIAVIVWQAWWGNRLRRMQFLLSFVFVWILLGTVAAILLSSAGPCFYDLVVAGENPYDSLMAYLREVNETRIIRAVHTQEWVWGGYLGKHHYAGISAMPSVHVGVAFLYAVVSFKAYRWAGILAAAYFVVILVGSVHLGWHYAIDGYAAVLGVLAIWPLAGRVASRVTREGSMLCAADSYPAADRPAGRKVEAMLEPAASVSERRSR